MVGEGMGMTLIPELAVPRKGSRKDGVSYIPFADPKPVRRIGMLFRSGSYRQQTFQRIQQVILQQIKL